MRFLKSAGVAAALVFTGCAGLFGQTPRGDNVAATWHFAGSAELAKNPNFDNVKKILTLAPSLEFQKLVLNRFSGWLGKSLFSATNDETVSTLRPLLDDLLANESFWVLGGTSNGPLNFIVAVRLDDPRAKAWQAALQKLKGPPGFRTMQPKGWFMVENGRDLEERMGQYLQQVTEQGRPGPALGKSWLEADIDWPRLSHWLPDSPYPLKPARTKITFTDTNHSLFMKALVIYPRPVPWKFDPWRIPTNIINDPLNSLVSFATGQDIAAYMSDDEPLSRLTDNPLAGQFYVWALGVTGMALQTYGAWPVADAAASLQRLGTEAPAAFNPSLKKRGAGLLLWQPERHALLYSNLSKMPPVTLQVAPEPRGQYLMASIFPMLPGRKPPPDELYQQFLNRTNVVYYDWEGTGRRLEEWRLLSGMLPVLPPAPQPPPPAIASSNSPALPRTPPPLVVEENWLAGVTGLLMQENSVTLITRTAPAELAIVRQSPFAVTSLELVILSHWLSGTGPAIDINLLTPKAKVTGPGIKPASP